MKRSHGREARQRQGGRGWLLPLLLALAVAVVVGGVTFWPRSPQGTSASGSGSGTNPGAAVAAVDPAAPGRLTAMATVVDLGRVPFDEVAEARYELVNTGGREVRLVGKPAVKTLAGC